MAKISQTFGASFFSSDDVTQQGETLTIDRVGEGDVGKESRLIMYFSDSDKALPLNKTNATAIAEKYGDETDDWEGKPVHLYRDKTTYQGKSTPCIRVRVPKQGSGSSSSSASASATPSART